MLLLNWRTFNEPFGSTTTITFAINQNHRIYAGYLPADVVVKKIATAKGELGICADYLKQTVEGLKIAGLVDEELFELHNQVSKFSKIS